MSCECITHAIGTVHALESPMTYDDVNRREDERNVFFVESVSENGDIVLRLPGGHAWTLAVPVEMARYYRRLIPSDRT